MKILTSAITSFRIIWTDESARIYRTCCRKYSTTEEEYTLRKKKEVHPYCNIHPWKSETEFAKSLVNNIIYNADGIVTINKPYGIPVFNKFRSNIDTAKKCHKIVKEAGYSIQDVLPYVAKELDVPTLIPCTGSEKYMSGIYIFGINDNICSKIKKACLRAVHSNKYRKYWGITIRVPNEIKGAYHLGMTLEQSPSGDKKPVILKQWTSNAVKRNDVKILNLKYRILSNSTHNLSSLIEIDASTRKWHSIRLFASTMLYSPILGDNYHGSRAQEIMGTWIKINPFAESCWNLPKMNSQLLELLNIKPSQQEIIPAHLHLRSVNLLSFGKEEKDILMEAPLTDPFDWTCKQLMFKNIPYNVNNINNKNNEDEVELAMLHHH